MFLQAMQGKERVVSSSSFFWKNAREESAASQQPMYIYRTMMYIFPVSFFNFFVDKDMISTKKFPLMQFYCYLLVVVEIPFCKSAVSGLFKYLYYTPQKIKQGYHLIILYEFILFTNLHIQYYQLLCIYKSNDNKKNSLHSLLRLT